MTFKAISVNPIFKKNLAQKLWFKRGESPKAPLVLETYGRDKVYYSIKKR
jgi:hypothetical protein